MVKASPGVLVAANLRNWNTAAGVTVMALDATAVLSNGTLAVFTGVANASPCVMTSFGLPTAPSRSQPSTLNITWAPGTVPTTLTLTAECTFSAEVE